jgi:hypothetical protein
LAITSKQLDSVEKLEQFWEDPFAHTRTDYSKRPATVLEDFIAYCFFMSAWVPSRHARAMGFDSTLDMSEGIYRVRDQLAQVLYIYAAGGLGSKGKTTADGPIRIGVPGNGNWLAITWTIDTIVDEEVIFVLTTGGLETHKYRARVDRTALSGTNGQAVADKLREYAPLNGRTFAVIKLWKLADWCKSVGLLEVSRILHGTIDAVGDEFGDVDLLAKQVELFADIQGSCRRSSLSRSLSARS